MSADIAVVDPLLSTLKEVTPEGWMFSSNSFFRQIARKKDWFLIQNWVPLLVCLNFNNTKIPRRWENRFKKLVWNLKSFCFLSGKHKKIVGTCGDAAFDCEEIPKLCVFSF